MLTSGGCAVRVDGVVTVVVYSKRDPSQSMAKALKFMDPFQVRSNSRTPLSRAVGQARPPEQLSR